MHSYSFYVFFCLASGMMMLLQFISRERLTEPNRKLSNYFSVPVSASFLSSLVLVVTAIAEVQFQVSFLYLFVSVPRCFFVPLLRSLPQLFLIAERLLLFLQHPALIEIVPWASAGPAGASAGKKPLVEIG